MSWVYSKSKFPKDGSIEALYLFLNPKNIVSIYKGSTKINLLLVYHFYTKITKKNIESHHRFKNIIQVDVFCFEGRGSAGGDAWGLLTWNEWASTLFTLGSGELLTLSWLWGSITVVIVVIVMHSSKRRLSVHRPFLLLFYCASRKFLRRNFSVCLCGCVLVFHLLSLSTRRLSRPCRFVKSALAQSKMASNSRG